MNLLQYFFCFMSWFFGCQACGIVASQPRIKLSPRIGRQSLNHWINRKVPIVLYYFNSRVCAKSLQSCPTLCDPMDCSPPGSSVHGISHAKILERVAISSSRRSSLSRDQTCVSCIAGRFFTIEPPWRPSIRVTILKFEGGCYY